MNIKSRLKRKYGDNAVTEIMGTLILLAIAVSLFSVIYFFVFSIEVDDQPPSANIIGYIDNSDNKAYFEHWGGSPLNISEIRIFLNIGGTESKRNPYIDNDFSIINNNPDGDDHLWEIGEILLFYDIDDPALLSNKFVSVKIIDIISNSYLMSGTLQFVIINNPPTASNEIIQILENVTYTFKLADFNFEDLDGSDKLEFINICDTSFTYGGEIHLDGLSIGDGAQISWSDIILGKFEYINGSGVGNPDNSFFYASFDFNVSDGEKNSTFCYNMTIRVTPDNDPPILVIGSENPSNGSTSDAIDLIWNITIQDPDGDLINWTLECNNSQTNSSNNDVNGSKSLSLSGLAFSTVYTVWVNVSDLYWTTTGWYIFTTPGTIFPGAPTNLQGNADYLWINLTWNRGINANYTYIEKNSAPSWNREDPLAIMIYNGTGESYDDGLLSPHDTYYYQAWSYNITYNTWSTVSELSQTTLNHPPTSANNSVTTVLQDGFTFHLTNFSFNDADGDQLEYIKILNPLPSKGTLRLNPGGVAITHNQNISLDDINAGRFYFAPQNKGTYTFNFKVGDGYDYSSIEYVMTIIVT